MIEIYIGDYLSILNELNSKDYKINQDYFNGITPDNFIWSENSVIDRPGALQDDNYLLNLGISLSTMSDYSVKLITQSSALINGLRLGIKQSFPVNNPYYITIIFFSNNGNRFEILIDKYGSLSDWPDGFMDTWEKAVIKILSRNN